MRLILLLLTAAVIAEPVGAQPGASSPAQDVSVTATQPPSAATEPAKQPPAAPEGQPGQGDAQLNLPVSLEKIKEALEQTPKLSLETLDARPTFRVQILERQKLDELLATLNFKTTKAPAGGVYWDEVQRQMWPSVDNPLRQPYAAFNQGELLTILIENLAGKYLAGKALNAVSNAERAHAEAAAREEVMAAIRDYCAAQPSSGAGIQICSTSSAIR
jgi:hypothetical protein